MMRIFLFTFNKNFSKSLLTVSNPEKLKIIKPLMIIGIFFLTVALGFLMGFLGLDFSERTIGWALQAFVLPDQKPIGQFHFYQKLQDSLLLEQVEWQ